MDYAQYIQKFCQHYQSALSDMGLSPDFEVPSLGAPPKSRKAVPSVLIVAPHPDDECLMGGYALRMRAEWKARVSVLPFSLGSKKERQSARLNELKQACQVLDFECLEPHQNVAAAIEAVGADVVFSPHREDGHPTHQLAAETTALAFKTLKAKDPTAQFLWFQTEFWAQMPKPNLLIPLRPEHVTLIGLALLKHVGEVSRNPYHLRLPSWYVDQVRRGSEMVQNGPGGSGLPGWIFGQLYTRVDV